MFWGLIMEPQRRYTQVVKKAFHISMAALDVGTSSDEPAQVMCSFEGRNYLLCTLSKTVLQCPLDLNFEVGDEISLTTNGKCHIHLTGYLVEETNELIEEEEEEEAEEEIESKEVKTKNKKRNKQELNGPSPKKVKKEQEESDDEADSDLDVNALLQNTLSSDDDDESFNGEDNEEEEAEEEESADGGEEEEDESGDEEEEDSWETDGDSEEEEVEATKKPKLNGHVKKQEQTPNEKDKKNKKQKNKEAKNSPVQETQSPPKKDTPKKLVQGGMIIEEIKEGQGPPAKSGKFISVYYEGRLKNNNKMFDSHKQGQGFGFKLGGGEVIKGWDVGLVGMKVGGKRRITCPPHMAYGAKGSPPAIPGNSTLVFEVELKKIR